MSRGPGAVEAAIAALFAKTHDRALTIAEIAAAAFDLGDGEAPSRAQRLSATRAAHRFVRRMQVLVRKYEALYESAYDPASADYLRGHHLAAKIADLGGGRYLRYRIWRATETTDGQLLFHPPDFPVAAWEITFSPAGAAWHRASRVTVERRAIEIVSFGKKARLKRCRYNRLTERSRGGRLFAFSRTGEAARQIDRYWHYDHDGAAGIRAAMDFDKAVEILEVPEDFSARDILTAYRAAVKAKAHPTPILDNARSRLLDALGLPASAHAVFALMRPGRKPVERAKVSRKMM